MIITHVHFIFFLAVQLRQTFFWLPPYSARFCHMALTCDNQEMTNNDGLIEQDSIVSLSYGRSERVQRVIIRTYCFHWKLWQQEVTNNYVLLALFPCIMEDGEEYARKKLSVVAQKGIAEWIKLGKVQV